MSLDQFASWGFGLWFALSAANQVKPLARRIPMRHAVANVLPNWKFFAPEPGRSDSRLAFREFVAGEWGGWQEVHPVERSRWRHVWNPGKFDSKAISDLSSCLLEDAGTVPPQALVLCWHYLALLEFVQRSASGSASQIMFALLDTAGFKGERSLRLRFISAVHRV